MISRLPNPLNRMWVRLSLYFSSFAILSALLLIVAGQLLVADGVRQSLLPEQLQAPGGIVDTLGQYYTEQNGWDGVDNLMLGAQATFRLWAHGIDLAIVDQNGELIYSISQRAGNTNAPRSAAAARARRAGAQNPNAQDGVGGNGATMRRMAPIQLPITSRSEIVGFLQARAIIVDSGDTSARDLFQLLRRYLLLFALGGGLLGIVVGVMAGRNLTAPLMALAAAARAIGAGNLRQRVPLQGGEEVAAVAQAFNEMAAALEAAETLRRNLIADVAHELRTPLSVLQANLRAILDDVYALDKREITKLYTQSRLLHRLVNDLHELAQAEAGQLPLDLQPTDLRPLLQETIDLFQPMADDANITLQPELAATLPAVTVDPVRMGQVFHNVLGNALRYTPPQGTVAIHSMATATHVQVAMTDSGEGIAPEHLPHIFDRFYRIDRARARDTGGTGLGLAIVRAIVEAHGGAVVVTSPGVGQGATFTITLPLSTIR